jgi:amino acid transporter
MKNLIINFAILLSLVGVWTFMPVLQTQALNCDNPATPAEQIKCGACGASGQPACPAAPNNDIGDTVRTIVNTLSLFAGAIAVIMIIIGGFRYITSGGKEEGVKSAKNTILYAIIGLVVVGLAQIIVHFVLNNTPK